MNTAMATKTKAQIKLPKEMSKQVIYLSHVKMHWNPENQLSITMELIKIGVINFYGKNLMYHIPGTMILKKSNLTSKGGLTPNETRTLLIQFLMKGYSVYANRKKLIKCFNVRHLLQRAGTRIS